MNKPANETFNQMALRPVGRWGGVNFRLAHPLHAAPAVHSINVQSKLRHAALRFVDDRWRHGIHVSNWMHLFADSTAGCGARHLETMPLTPHSLFVLYCSVIEWIGASAGSTFSESAALCAIASQLRYRLRGG